MIMTMTSYRNLHTSPLLADPKSSARAKFVGDDEAGTQGKGKIVRHKQKNNNKKDKIRVKAEVASRRRVGDGASIGSPIDK